MGNTITIKVFGSLYYILDSLKMERFNNRLSNLEGMSIANIISFVIFVLSLKKLVNLSAKIQALKNLNKTNLTDTFKSREGNLIKNQFQHYIIRIEAHPKFSNNQP